MTLKIPKSLKKEFNKGFDEYIETMGRCVEVYFKPTQVRCPNCHWDSVQKKSTNIWDSSFLRAVNIFVGTSAQKIIFPQPFNVSSAPGVVYDPAVANPRILKTTFCPVCRGEGILTSENKDTIKAVVTIGKLGSGSGNAKQSQFVSLSVGRDGRDIFRLKTFASNYAVCRDAVYFIVDGIKLKSEVPARVKGLGADHITECFLVEVTIEPSVTTVFDADPRININEAGQTSDQASPATPTIPPAVPGDDVW